MRTILLLVFFFTLKFSIAQVEHTNFELIDKQVRSIKSKSALSLAEKLTAPYKTQIEKVRAIFSWITQNIRYDIKGANSPDGPYTDLARTIIAQIDSAIHDDYNDRIVQKVLNERQAVCDGYARLFKTLCDNSNIEAVIINGNVRWYSDPVGMITYKRHAWNAVSIDNKWYLLDPTWASGTVEGTVFRKQYDNFYFLTDPVKFFNDHFPDDNMWTLFPDPPGFQQFYNSIFICQDFYGSGIISYEPKVGLIEPTMANNKIKFELETDDIRKKLYIVEYPQDTIQYDAKNDSQFLYELHKPHITRSEIEGKKVYLYHYSLSCKARQIFVYYNDKLVLCYGINRAK